MLVPSIEFEFYGQEHPNGDWITPLSCGIEEPLLHRICRGDVEIRVTRRLFNENLAHLAGFKDAELEQGDTLSPCPPR